MPRDHRRRSTSSSCSTASRPSTSHTNAICTLHPGALDQAAERDREAADGGGAGPLHGVPVLVKDNVDTSTCPPRPGRWPWRTRRRRAGTRCWSSGCATPGWSCSARPTSRSGPTSATSPRRRGGARYGGLTRNPYGLNRSAGGSSSGSGAAVAAGLAPLAVGTETDGSISCPAAFNGCVGIKPTVGLVPTDGVVPISRSQDSPGPMAATVADGGGAADRARRQRRRLRGPRGARPAGRQADRRPAGVVLGLLPARRRRRRAGRRAARRRGRDDRRRHRPRAVRRRRSARTSCSCCSPSSAAGCAEYLATRPGDVPRSLEEVVEFNRAQRRDRARVVRPVAVREGAGRPGGRQPGVRRGPGPLRGGRPRGRHRQGAARARARRAGHPVLRAGLPDRPGERRALPRQPAPARPRWRATRC